MKERSVIGLSGAAVALIIGPAIWSAILDCLPDTGGKIYGGWLVSASGQQVVCRTKCHAPDMALYRGNFKSRRGTHGF